MTGAATGEAAGGQAALAAASTNNLETLRRVRGALLGQLGGDMPGRPPEPECRPRTALDRRSCTPLGPLEHVRRPR